LIYSGSLELYNNTGLDAETTYFYKAFAVYADDTGTHYSLGVATNATTADTPDYQPWDGYPDSPDLTVDYPYQAIYTYSSYTRLIIATTPFTGGTYNLIQSLIPPNYKIYTLAGTWQEGGSNECSAFVHANFDIYKTGDPLTLIFAQDTF
jgi:hypothetical protein